MTASKYICVLGGTGFLGSRLVSLLADQGYRVRVPTRSAARHRQLLVLPTVDLVEANIHDTEVLSNLVSGCGHVINLVGILNEKGRKGAGFALAHTELARRLVAACAQARVPKLVQMSALRADAERGPSHYLRTKGEAERIIAGNDRGLAWTIFQPSVIFGPGDSFLNRFARLLRLTPGVLPLAMPGAMFAPVHVDDVAAAFARAVADPATSGRSYQLCGPARYSLRQLVELVRDAIGVHRYVVGLPEWAARLQAALMDFVPGKPFSTDNFLSLTVNSVCTENGFAPLGIKPRSLEANLQSSLSGSIGHSLMDDFRQGAGR